MHFLVQKVDGRVVHDFSFALLQAKEWYDWSGKEKLFIRFSDGNFDGIRIPGLYVPVGDIAFVSSFLSRFYPDRKEALRPLNVPEILFPFAGRRIANIWCKDDYAPLQGIKDVYAKSMDVLKDPFNGSFYDVPANYERKDFRHCQVSEIIDIVSEWRAIVHHGAVLYIGNYSGDPLAFPDAGRIRGMAAAYTDAPVAYTLDVAVTKSGETVVVECHRFFSCGLYGFNDLARYPKMLSQAWKEMIRPKI